MKRCVFITSMVLVAVTILAPFVSRAGEIKPNVSALTVHDIQSNPHASQGTITITGVVAKVVKGKAEVFTLVDTSEARRCKSTGCASFYLPVKFDGSFPKEWDEVTVTGSFDGGKNAVFVASKVVVVRHLTFG